MPSGFEVFDEAGNLKIGLDAPICRILQTVNDGFGTNDRNNVLLGQVDADILAAGQVLFWAAGNPAPVQAVTGAPVSYAERVSYSILNNEIYVTNTGLVRTQFITCLIGVRI